MKIGVVIPTLAEEALLGRTLRTLRRRGQPEVVVVADCGSTYAISRGLRSALTLDRRESIIALLSAVARADGVFLKVERREILQIAGELGIDPGELAEISVSS